MTPPLDPGTLWVVAGALGFTAALAFTALWLQARGVPGLGSLALAHALLASSGALLAGAGRIPSLLSFTAGHALAVLGAALLVDGIRLLHGLAARRRLSAALFVGVTAALSVIGDVTDARAPALLSIAIAGPNAILGALFADASATVLRRGRRRGEAVTGAFVAACFGLVGAGRLAVAGLALSGTRAADYWTGHAPGDSLLAGALLASMIAGMGWAFGLFATINRLFIASSTRQAGYRASLDEVAVTVMNRLELTPLLEAVVSRGVALLEADRGFVYLESPDGKALQRRVWVGDAPVDEFVAPDEGAVGRAWRRGQSVNVADYDSWEGRSPMVPRGMFGSMLAVPLRSGGRAIGALGIARRRLGRHFNAEQAALLASFGDLVSVAVDNARLFEGEREARERAERLQAATHSLSGSLDLTSVSDAILRELERVVPADAVLILRLAGSRLEIIASRGHATPYLGQDLDSEAGDRRRARVLEERAPVILNDAPGLPDAPWTAAVQAGRHSWLGVPLLLRGEATGVLALAKQGAGFYTREHARLAAAFADQAAIAIENARLYQEARSEIENRKRAQEELARSESRFRDLFDGSLGLICTHDLGGKLLSVNPAAAAALACAPSDLVGRSLSELLPKSQRAEFDRYLADIQRDGRAEGVMTILSSAGKRRAWRYRNVLRRAPGGAYVIGFAQDVTEELRSQAALRESEQRFRQVADNLDAVLFVRQVEPPAILYMSPAYRTIFGRDPDGLVPRADALFADVLPEDRPRVIAAYGTDQAEIGGFDEKYRVMRTDGAIRWIRTRTFPGRRHADGRVERVIGISEDITPLKLAEELRADLVRTLVHDLRTPLTSIVGCLDMLRDGRSQTWEVLPMAERNARRLQAMVDDLLDIERLEQGGLELRRHAVALAELIGQARDSVASSAEQKGLSLTRAVEGSLPRAWADPDLLLRVLTNLVGNAVKFTPSEGRVVVSAELADAGMLRVRVRDTGPGIPDDLAPRLFQRFVTGRSKGAGAGLGLMFCRLVVEAHGGRIDIEKVEPPGASVVFTVPAVTPVEAGEGRL